MAQEIRLNELLKMRREQRHVSLHSIHQETRIPVQYLEGMENGQWQVFPAEVYLLGFLRKYAVFLGLNPEEVVELYKKEQRVVLAQKEEEDKKRRERKTEDDQSVVMKGVLL